MRLKTVVVVAGLMITSGLVEAEDVYRWVDKSGAVVYSQVPPEEDVSGEWIKVKPPPAVEPQDSAKQTEEKGKKEKDTAVLDEEDRKERCEAGRHNLSLLQEADQDVSFKVGDGEPVKFTPEEREQKLKEAQAVIDAYCDDKEE